MDDSKFLGPVIKAWFKANDWPQSVSEGLARAKGWEIGPWASQISICMSGRLQPKPPFFVALGLFNQAIAERDFVGVTDRRLMDRLRAGEPIVHDGCCPERSCAAGVPWNAMDFFGCYIGVISPPEFAAPKPEITEEQVEQFVEALRDGFRELCLSAMNPDGPKAVWNEIAKRSLVKGCAPEDVEYAQEVVSGLRGVTVAEAERFAMKYKTCPVADAMDAMAKGLGGNLKELLQLHAAIGTKRTHSASS